MKNNPVVTVGICARNAERTIGGAVESVLAQDFTKESMEIILVDDGSTDRTLSIMRKYASDVDFKCRILNGAWKGVSRVRNSVIDNAEGEYIVWVDSDMILPSDHVRKQVEFMELHPNVGIAGARFQGLPEKGLVITLQNLEWEAMQYINRSKKTSNLSFHVCGGSIYRTEAIRQIGGFDVKITGAGEDEDIEWRITKAGWLTFMGTNAFFFERRKKTWRALWKQFFWYGYGAHYLIHNKKRSVTLHDTLNGLLLSGVAYRLTHRKVSFLLPLQYYFKYVAWLFGFLKARLEGYGHI